MDICWLSCLLVSFGRGYPGAVSSSSSSSCQCLARNVARLVTVAAEPCSRRAIPAYGMTDAPSRNTRHGKPDPGICRYIPIPVYTLRNTQSCGGRLDQNDTARCVYHHRAQAAIFSPITSDGHRSRHWHLNPTSSHPLTLTFLFLVYLQGLDGRSREPPNLIDVPSRGHGDELPAFLEMLDDWPRRLLVRPEAF